MVLGRHVLRLRRDLAILFRKVHILKKLNVLVDKPAVLPAVVHPECSEFLLILLLVK